MCSFLEWFCIPLRIFKIAIDNQHAFKVVYIMIKQ